MGDQLLSFREMMCGVSLVATTLYGASVYYLYKNIGLMGKYLGIIEQYILNNKPLKEGFTFGWEHFFDSAIAGNVKNENDNEDQQASKPKNKSRIVRITTIFFVAQLVVMVVLMILLPWLT